MTAKVIQFRPRRPLAADPAALVRAARGSMSRQEFAAMLSALLGWDAGPGMIRAWEDGVPAPPDVLEACRSAASRNDAPPEHVTAAAFSMVTEPAGPEDEIVIPCRALDGRVIWVSIPRRSFLSGGLGAATLAAVGAATGARAPGAAAVRLLAPSAAANDLSPVERLEQLRRLLVDADNLYGSGRVIPAVQGQIHMIRQLREGCRGSDRRALLVMQAKYAEFVGWLHQDSRDFRAAQYWLDRSLEWSCAGADRELSTYVMARKSQLAGDMSEADSAVDLADAAASKARKRSRLKATAAVYGAHGYALARQRRECLRAIDRAREIADSLEDDSPWAAWLDTSYIEVQRARCLTTLGDHAGAADVFRQAIGTMAPTFRRDRGVYLAREALAHADARDPEQAAGVGMQAVVIAQDTQSGRVTSELALVGTRLAPWAAVPAVADFRDALTSIVAIERTN